MNMNNKEVIEIKGTILVVDDTHEILQFLVALLSEHGYQVRPATNSKLAISTALTDPPDLILLNVMMPDMDGYAVCKALKEDERTVDIPIIFIRPLNEVFDTVKAFHAGGVDYISQPFQGEEVLARVSTHIALRAAHRQIQQHQVQLEQEIIERQRTEKRLKKLGDRLTHELEIAHRVQQSLLPIDKPKWDILDVSCYSKPAIEVGGDLYVYHSFRRQSDTSDGGAYNRYAIAVGDVSGKGMPAALLMSASMASFRANVGRGLSPGAFLSEMDLAIAEHTRTTQQNCAMLYLEIVFSDQMVSPDIHTPVARACVANAGGVTPIIKRHNGTIEWVNVGGIPLGIGLGAKSGYQEMSFDLHTGDIIILTSDGVVEAKDADATMFGFERLDSAMRNSPQTNADAMVEYLCTEIETFIGDTTLHDDITIVVVQV